MPKVVDTVSHLKLIYKLKKIGLHNNIVYWIQKYLSNRKFYNRVYNVTFPKNLILYLAFHRARPLYLTYTDGQIKVIKKCEIFQFADDCKLAKITFSIVDWYEWYNESQLLINIVKSIFMPVCSPAACTYHINNNNNNILVQANSFKNLSITYSDLCCFNAHIVNIV